MKILHVLSQNELTGAEAYAIALIGRQVAAGHEVAVVSDTLNLPLPEGVRYVPLPIDRRSFKYRVLNIFSLVRLFRKFDPRVVHAHSRAASWVCRIATIGGPALVSTIHGRQHWHTRLKWNDIYGQRIIAICGHLRDHLTKDFGISPKRIDLIRNLVESREYRIAARPRSPGTLRLGLFGRMSGPKGKIWAMLAREVLPDLMREFPKMEVLIGGGTLDSLSESDRKSLVTFLETFPERARFFGRSPHLAEQIAQVDYVVAAGRIAVESLYAGKLVFGFGEYKPVGWITRSSLRSALLSNFGDVGADRENARWWPTNEIWTHLRSAFQGEIQFDLEADDLDRFFGEKETYRQIESVYHQAILTKRYPLGIPSLMFHKVVEGEYNSSHRTFIRADRFEKNLKTLRLLGKKTITFADLHDACQGKRDFPKRPILLTFDDGYRDTLELAAPALRRQKMKAVAYLLADRSITTNVWDTRANPYETDAPLLNPAERQALLKTGVFEIGSHGLAHRALGALPIGEREFEISESKRLLEEEFGTEIRSFAYAYGNHTYSDAEMVTRAGYSFAVGTNTHFGLEENLFRIFRTNVFPEDGFLSMLKKSSPLYRFYFSAKRKLRNDRRNRMGAFHPKSLHRGIVPASAIAGVLLAVIPLVRQQTVVASTVRLRNVYGGALESCLNEDGDGFSFSNFCRSPLLGTSPANICVENEQERTGSIRFECVSPDSWNQRFFTGQPFRTKWSSTNLRSLAALPAAVAHPFISKAPNVRE